MVIHQICTRCVMDTTAEEINFDSAGVCNFCRSFDSKAKPILERARSSEGPKVLDRLVQEIKKMAGENPMIAFWG